MYIIYMDSKCGREYFQKYDINGLCLFISGKKEAFLFDSYEETLENLDKIRLLCGSYANINMKCVRDC